MQGIAGMLLWWLWNAPHCACSCWLSVRQDYDPVHMLCLQGIVGTMPWVALGFSTLYLQLLGFSDLNAAILVAVFSFGCSIGSFGGGYIGKSLFRSHGLTSSTAAPFLQQIHRAGTLPQGETCVAEARQICPGLGDLYGKEASLNWRLE